MSISTHMHLSARRQIMEFVRKEGRRQRQQHVDANKSFGAAEMVIDSYGRQCFVPAAVAASTDSDSQTQRDDTYAVISASRVPECVQPFRAIPVRVDLSEWKAVFACMRMWLGLSMYT